MLVLSRKEGERLMIGDDVVITVTRISGNRITLGIEAPRHVRIVRGELAPLEEASAAARDQQQQASPMKYIELDAAMFQQAVG